MHTDQSITVPAIRKHYDQLSILYRTFWGHHIHHGLWECARTAKDAQVALIERLVAIANVERRSHVLDVGCGLGGSSVWLARNLECSVVGLTISPVQLRMAKRRASRERLIPQVQFRLEDANLLNYENSFDCIWIIECSEHLFDKADFFRRTAAALRPGGVLALCAWLVSDHPLADSALGVIARVCRGMLCPSLGTKREYCEWITRAGLCLQTSDDMTAAVTKTWDICRNITQIPILREVMKTAESDVLQFVDSFNDIAQAYADGLMAYGMFTAVKERPL